jgi:poly-gamma-glutamate synthesis protein (capsule biosynthesis protein)
VPEEQQRFAHALIDLGGVSVVHGHSSHHPKAIEVYHNHLILYGCGDFINDYEGIVGHEEFRDDLVLMYFASVKPGTGDLLRVELTPLQMRRMRLNFATDRDAEWLRRTLDRESRGFGTRVEAGPCNQFLLTWT